jgi:glycosyltransferase involved in cell wall biosynthesis
MKIAIVGPIATAHLAPFLDAVPPRDFPPGYTGAPFMATLIGELLRRGHEVAAITAGGYPAAPGAAPQSLRGPRFSFHCCPERAHAVRWSRGRPGRLLDMFADERRHLRSVIREVAPDLVHAHWTYEFALAAIGCGRPYLVTAHDDPVAVARLSRSPYRLGRLFMALRVLRAVPRLTAVSSDLGLRLRRLTRAPIDVVPNPLDASFLGAGALREAPQAPQAQQELCIVTVLNGWGAWKNAAVAIRAFAEFRRDWPQARLQMFGADYEPGGLAERWARSRALADGIGFRGPVSRPHLIEELRAAQALLHPSLLESCPMGVVEAMSLGLPVVGGSDSGGVAEMVGEAGLLVDVTSPPALAAALRRLFTEPGRYRACSVQALARAQAYAPAAVVDRYEALYREVLRADAPRGAGKASGRAQVDSEANWP